ncbi:MAG: peroxiredoxin [Leifsonia sp.]
MMTPSPEQLIGSAFPPLVLPSTIGEQVDLSNPELGAYVLFLYPRTGNPHEPDSEEWMLIPGAKGCTGEVCHFRDLMTDFTSAGFSVLGASSQDGPAQREVAQRLSLKYPLLSDPDLRLAEALGIDTFTFEGVRMFVRSTVVVSAGMIQAVYRGIKDPLEHPMRVLEDLVGAGGSGRAAR